jgi:2'-5' RNA ligase
MEIRSFLAFELPPEIKRILINANDGMKRELSHARWVKVENIHLTLVFLGNFPSNKVDSVDEAFEEICNRYAPFTVQVRGIGTFGGRRNPRVLWAGIEGDIDRMGTFRDELQEVLMPFGIKKEARKFKPHLTLARFRDTGRLEPGLPRILADFKDMSSPICTLERLLFFKSDLKPGGAVYTKLKSWGLGGDR